MPKLKITPTSITDRKRLRTLIALAHNPDAWVDVTNARVMLETRAKQLEAEDLLPESWDAPVARGEPPAPAPVVRTKLLDAPAWELLDKPERRGALAVAVKALEHEHGLDSATAIQRFQDAWQQGRNAFDHSEPETVSKVLERAGVEAPGESLMLLDRAGTAATKTLEDGLAPIRDQQLDPQGRVLLDKGFDVPRLLHSDEAQERRWRRARELDASYAERARWAADDRLHLDSGVDLLRTLERPLVVAEARQAAEQTARQLDQAIESAREPRQRAKALDKAISALQTERGTIELAADPLAADAPPAAPVRTLDESTPATFVALPDPDLMMQALDLREANKSSRMSLDQAAAAVMGGIPAAVPDLPHVDVGSSRAELHQRILDYQKAHPGISYQKALSALTGAGDVLPDREG